MSDSQNLIDMQPPEQVQAEPTVANVTYDHALSRIRGSWRGIVAILLLVIGFLLLSIVIGGLGIGIEIARGAITLDQINSGLVPFTPGVLLSTNIALALTIPLAMTILRGVIDEARGGYARGGPVVLVLMVGSFLAGLVATQPI